ncbi:MAG: VOC family protein [Rhodospirillaceae bacterium]|jgi:catechol 2,3-dioxygenase-like lactoylglutathione lyase family enzyme|nr:VOC family protein [Rhodospirillaceae bacterium]MBT4938432.1 VOC family protein [Rhodospirillaceae bacterium]MBT5941341.1 VOC family protein [Rhodospirillaceae bacterium]MBT7267695.1 VOC family protein [Rhodospirillaceae bacterium]
MTTPALNLSFLSHGTLISKDLEASRKFYTDFLGLEVVRTSEISLMARLGGEHVYAVVEQKKHNAEMHFLFHNGLDVASDAEVDAAHKIAVDQADKWGMTKISNPKTQHGTYSFYFWDLDSNCWEILSNPKRGYMWIFEQGDQDGKGHWDKNFDRSVTDD